MVPDLRAVFVQLYTEGGPAAKVATTGAGILWAALSETALSLAFAVCMVLWFCDIGVGILRALSEARSLTAFRWGKFFEGMLKGPAAALGVVFGTAVDHSVGLLAPGAPDGMAVTGILSAFSLSFAISVAENLAYWIPAVRDKVLAFQGSRKDA